MKDEYEDTAVSPKELYQSNESGKEPNLDEDYLEGSLAIVSEIDCKHAIEELLMQETFSRDECNKLTRIIQSRVVDFQFAEASQNGVQKELPDGGTGNPVGWGSLNHAGQLPETISYSSSSLNALSPGSPAYQIPRVGLHNSAVMESNKWLQPNCFSPSSKPLLSYGHSKLNTNTSLSARKRNCSTFTSGDILDQARKVRLKPMENVLHISKFKQIDLSGGYLESEACKAPSTSIKRVYQQDMRKTPASTIPTKGS